MATKTKQKTQVVKQSDVQQQVVTVDELRDILLSYGGQTIFASFKATYDMDKKMLKTGNPFIGTGITKVSQTSIMVNFDYKKSMERRGDKASGKGNWQQAITIDGRLTPISVHKADVLEYDDDGNPVKLVENARTYLRAEDRGTKSEYLQDGKLMGENAVNAVKAFLPKRNQQETVAFRNVTLNNIDEMTIDKVKYIVSK